MGLVEWPEFIFLFYTNKLDFAIIVIVFCFTVFYNLEYGVYVGAGLSAALVLFKARRRRRYYI